MKLRGLIPLFGFLIVLAGFAFGLTRDPRILPSELIEKPFPDFALENLSGDKTITPSIFEGQVSLVNVFGSWCVACTVEHPQLMSLKSEPNFQLIGIDWRDTKEAATRWLVRHGNPYDTVIFDPNSKLIVELGVTGAPETFVVDKAGQIRYKHVGIITAKDWTDTLRPLVESLQ